MTRVLALDLATTTGWAYGEPGGQPTFGHVRFSKPGSTHGETYRTFRNWLDTHWATSDQRMRPAMVIFESPAVPSFMSGKTNVSTTRLLFGLAANLVEWAHDRVELNEVTTSQVRSHFIGGNFKASVAKPYTVNRCHELGWMVATHDEADACAVWNYQCSLLDPRVGINTSPLFRVRR